ncbi:hypothetical protein HDU93_006000 [Gonapodya sp. JEL0774]|nr:hypothetical protein HDU93_006000 [Gonapodya sp. JEL0774]
MFIGLSASVNPSASVDQDTTFFIPAVIGPLKIVYKILVTADLSRIQEAARRQVLEATNALQESSQSLTAAWERTEFLGSRVWEQCWNVVDSGHGLAIRDVGAFQRTNMYGMFVDFWNSSLEIAHLNQRRTDATQKLNKYSQQLEPQRDLTKLISMFDEVVEGVRTIAPAPSPTYPPPPLSIGPPLPSDESFLNHVDAFLRCLSACVHYYDRHVASCAGWEPGGEYWNLADEADRKEAGYRVREMVEVQTKLRKVVDGLMEVKKEVARLSSVYDIPLPTIAPMPAPVRVPLMSSAGEAVQSTRNRVSTSSGTPNGTEHGPANPPERGSAQVRVQAQTHVVSFTIEEPMVIDDDD